jgi:protein-tyrosine phosphatase
MPPILPHLHISDYPSAANLSFLQAQSISHIINLTFEFEDRYPDQYSYLRIPIKDTLSDRLTPYFHSIAAFAASAKASGGKCLVHCAEGVSRSATGVLACLIINEGLRLRDAWLLLQRAKPDVEPNRAFLNELRALEYSVFGEWSDGKLTPMDVPRDPAIPNWKENLALLQAWAATSEGSLPAENEWERIVVSELQAAGRVSREELQTRIESAVVWGLEAWGGSGRRDQQARGALEEILMHKLVGSGACSDEVLLETLVSISGGDTARELYMDVPMSRAWLEALSKSRKPLAASIQRAT